MSSRQRYRSRLGGTDSTSDLSTSRTRLSRVSPADGVSGPPHTARAASTVNPPRKTARRRLPARAQELELGAGAEQRHDQVRAVARQVLAVVEDQERGSPPGLAAELGRDRLQRAAALALGDAQRGGDRARDRLGVADGAE